MKKVLFHSGILTMILFFIASVSFAQDQKSVPKADPQKKANMVINQSAKAIHDAHFAVKEGKNFTGDLASAVKHQKFARKMYAEGQYAKAIQHSYYARKQAVKAIKANNKPVKPEYEQKSKAELNGKLTPDEELENDVAGEENVSEEELVKEEVIQLSVE
ncbi:MAG: hypothetical protein ABIJ16_14525 [Bacteroidota bacterium]